MTNKRGTIFSMKAVEKAAGGVFSKTLEEVQDGLDRLVMRSRQVIFQTESVFPFDFFPNQLIICPNRITVIDRGLFYQEEYPMQLESVNGAKILRNAFFASLEIDTFGVEKPPPLKFLTIRTARLARRYILALVECKKNGVDLNKYPVDELKVKLKQIGEVQEGKMKSRVI
jgi:hypothetical protein